MTVITNAAMYQQFRRSSSTLLTQESSTHTESGAPSSQPSSVNSVLKSPDVSLQSLTTPKVLPFPLQGMMGCVPPLMRIPHHQVHMRVANATMPIKMEEIRKTFW